MTPITKSKAITNKINDKTLMDRVMESDPSLDPDNSYGTSLDRDLNSSPLRKARDSPADFSGVVREEATARSPTKSNYVRIKHKVWKTFTEVLHIIPKTCRLTHSQRKFYRSAQEEGLNCSLIDRRGRIRPQVCVTIEDCEADDEEEEVEVTKSEEHTVDNTQTVDSSCAEPVLKLINYQDLYSQVNTNDDQWLRNPWFLHTIERIGSKGLQFWPTLAVNQLEPDHCLASSQLLSQSSTEVCSHTSSEEDFDDSDSGCWGRYEDFVQSEDQNQRQSISGLMNECLSELSSDTSSDQDFDDSDSGCWGRYEDLVQSENEIEFKPQTDYSIAESVQSITESDLDIDLNSCEDSIISQTNSNGVSDSAILVEGVAAPETGSAVTDESGEELVQLMISLRNYYSQIQSDSADQELTQLMVSLRDHYSQKESESADEELTQLMVSLRNYYFPNQPD